MNTYKNYTDQIKEMFLKAGKNVEVETALIRDMNRFYKPFCIKFIVKENNKNLTTFLVERTKIGISEIELEFKVNQYLKNIA